MKHFRPIPGTAMALAAIAAMAAGAPSCNSSPSQVGLAGPCSLNSDCNSPLVCIFTFCHQQCNVSSDCPSGERCVPSSGTGTPVCQLPNETTCNGGTSCVANETCGSDFQCRAPCGPTTSCGQATTCVGTQCLDPGDPVDQALLDLASAGGSGAQDAAGAGPESGLSDAAAECGSVEPSVVNGDFDMGFSGFCSGYTLVTAPTQITTYGACTVADDPSKVRANVGDWVAFGDPDGGNGPMLICDGATVASTTVWTETVTAVPQTSYRFSFWVSNLEPSQSLPTLQGYVNSIPVGTLLTANPTPGMWTEYVGLWPSDASNQATLSIVDTNTSGPWNDFAIDDVSFTVLGDASTLDQSSAAGSADASFVPNPDAGTIGFTPTNFSLVGLDAGPMGDAGIFTGAPDALNEILGFVATIAQNDVNQTPADLYVMNSLTIDPTQSVSIGGSRPWIVLVRTTVTIQGAVDVTAGGYGVGGPGEPPATYQGIAYPASGSYGGSYCGIGGSATPLSAAAALLQADEPAGKTYGNASISPLMGGSACGGNGCAGGGAVQIVAGTSIVVDAGGFISAPGYTFTASGGGSGGAILLEAPSVVIRGNLAANGAGGWGGTTSGQSGQSNDQPAPAGTPYGGAGSAGASVNGGDGEALTAEGGTPGFDPSGGGGAGWIRINTAPGGLTVASTGIISPSMAPVTSCATQGTLAP